VLTRLSIDGEPVLGFEAPIVYQNNVQGRVVLGLRERPLVRVAQLSMFLMAVLVVVTVVAVAVAMYFVANWFSRPIKTISNAMDEIAKGHLDHRIAETRKDEFGLLFGGFDRMAQALQDARSGVSNAATKSAVAPVAAEPVMAEPSTIEPAPAEEAASPPILDADNRPVPPTEH
jgi:HAMP domain-containing protein